MTTDILGRLMTFIERIGFPGTMVVYLLWERRELLIEMQRSLDRIALQMERAVAIMNNGGNLIP